LTIIGASDRWTSSDNPAFFATSGRRSFDHPARHEEAEVIGLVRRLCNSFVGRTAFSFPGRR